MTTDHMRSFESTDDLSDRLAQYLPPETPVWTTGVNAPGCLPSPDNLRVFVTQAEARADIAERIEEFAGDMQAQEMETSSLYYANEGAFWADTDRVSVAAQAQAENVRGNADQDYSQAFSVQVDNMTHQPPVFWAQPSTAGDYFGGETKSDEYADVADGIHEARARQTFTPRDVPFGERDEWPKEDVAREAAELRASRIERGLPTLSQPLPVRVIQ